MRVLVAYKLAQEVIDGYYVKCPHCDALVELSEKVGVSVDAPGTPNLTFCSWKHLGSWITGIYQTGRQFEDGLEQRGRKRS